MQFTDDLPISPQSFYVEAIASPSIDYMLCSSAMKLAQSKGLHRHPAAAWKLSPMAVQSRSLLWWALYGYERQNAHRSGRPLVSSLESSSYLFGSSRKADA